VNKIRIGLRLSRSFVEILAESVHNQPLIFFLSGALSFFQMDLPLSNGDMGNEKGSSLSLSDEALSLSNRSLSFLNIAMSFKRSSLS